MALDVSEEEIQIVVMEMEWLHIIWIDSGENDGPNFGDGFREVVVLEEMLAEGVESNKIFSFYLLMRMAFMMMGGFHELLESTAFEMLNNFLWILVMEDRVNNDG